MARIIGAIASSHTPTIGFAFDQRKQTDPIWAPIFAAFAPVQRWLLEQKPDVVFYIFNDHGTSFFFDQYPVFALGIGTSYPPADEGGGARALPPLDGHSDLAIHIGNALVREEFDLSFFQDKALDHGAFSPLSVMWPHEPAWPAPIVPLQIGVIQAPFPSARRCLKLGHAVRRAIESYPAEQTVRQLAGVEKLPGTYPFTLARSVHAYRINKFFHDLIEPTKRATFLADATAAFAAAALDDIERDMIQRRDWRALIHYGASFFMLEKFGSVIGVSNMHIYAAMRGESLEALQQTRNVQVVYSTSSKVPGQ
jgi:Catalytic LigB subunit of aromatic ring-opening dioxygenase/Aromatic-ring-opening dioxygenase LigAB, LigA subunit